MGTIDTIHQPFPTESAEIQGDVINRLHHLTAAIKYAFLKCFQGKPIEKPHHYEGSQSVIYNSSFSGIKNSIIYIHNILIQHRIYNLCYRVYMYNVIHRYEFLTTKKKNPSFTVTKA